MNAIEFHHVGKMYRLGTIGTGTLSHDLNRWWQTAVLHREDPYLKIGQTNDRTRKSDEQYVWALRDIDFQVKQGDVVGIIGKNGAGKSTLLKLLSSITAPTTGEIVHRGRIASLLEVGTGFHPEMTGRENIYMNGAIMGMSRQEITRKLDDIVEFSGCARYVDTPLKRYSSGMTVRLGFAIAAFLEPEILVVDEVLAVGDADFQRKAIGKMQEVSHSDGRTVLFVSHNMAAVRNLCSRGIVLNNGQLVFDGDTDDAITYYLDTNISNISTQTIVSGIHRTRQECDVVHDVEMMEVRLLNEHAAEMATDEPLQLELLMKRNNSHHTTCQYSVVITDATDVKILNVVSRPMSIPQDVDTYKVQLTLDHLGLPKGRYKIHIAIGEKDFAKALKNYDIAFDLLSFEIKYIHSIQKDEYAQWHHSWGTILHNQENIQAQIITT